MTDDRKQLIEKLVVQKERAEKLEALREHLALGENQLDSGQRVNGDKFFRNLLGSF